MLLERKMILNKKILYEYKIIKKIEAGILLFGSEVKAIRSGNISISDAYVVSQEEAWIRNLHIGHCAYAASIFQHKPKRCRKLLLKKRQIRHLMGLSQKKGYTIVPYSLYSSPSGYIKIELAVVQGLNTRDKRAKLKEKEWKKDKQDFCH